MNRESKWTQKYKDSIDCSKPQKGFSQKAHCQGLKKKKMKKSQIVTELDRVVEALENMKLFKEANSVHNIFIKVASELQDGHEVSFPMDLEKALKKFSPDNFEVDEEGKWEDTKPISDFKQKSSKMLMKSPAALDDNHIIFYDENNEFDEKDGPFVVMNMVPKDHLDTLQNNRPTKWIKRGDDE
jgi:hypothetical protein